MMRGLSKLINLVYFIFSSFFTALLVSLSVSQNLRLQITYLAVQKSPLLLSEVSDFGLICSSGTVSRIIKYSDTDRRRRYYNSMGRETPHTAIIGKRNEYACN